MATNINNRLVCNEPHANLDSYYGPYNTVHAAYTALADTTVNGITYTKKYIGLTVGVWKDSSHTEITEYWFKGGLSESNLVEKTSDAGLPGGVKIVTFDKNGATGGVQNSVMTDADSMVMLPECTLTKSGSTFYKWSYNGNPKSPGETVTIGSSTVVQALREVPPTTQYTVSWNIPSNGRIEGQTSTGTPVYNNDRLDAGTTVILTVVANSGYQFKKWTRTPTGSTIADNVCTFQLRNNVSGVTAEVEAVISQYTLTYNSTEGIRELACKVDDEPAPSGVKHNEGSTVIFTAAPEEGYSVIWEGAPEDAQITDEGKTLTFILRGETTIRVKGEKKPVETGFYYYGCTSTENGAKGGGEDVNPSGETGTKWFTNPEEDLIPVEGINSEQIDNSKQKYNILYAITKNNVAPTCNLDGIEPIYFIPLNECDDDTIKNHFNVEVGWITGGNKTAGPLVTYGNYMFIYIDNRKVLDNQTFIISIGK